MFTVNSFPVHNYLFILYLGFLTTKSTYYRTNSVHQEIMTYSTTSQKLAADSGTIRPAYYSRRQMLSTLPSELKSRIVDFLDFEGVSSIRLTSRDFAAIGISQLWANGLILRPYRNHMQKLTEVYCCSSVAELVKKLTISLDDMDHGHIEQVSFVAF